MRTPASGSNLSGSLRKASGLPIPDWMWASPLMHLFLALNARRVAEPDSDDLEDQELLLLSRAEIERALREGAFKVVAWSAVVAMALNDIDQPWGATHG